MVFLRIRFNFLLDGLVFLLDTGSDWIWILVLRISIVYINQLLPQNYTAGIACAIAVSPFFNAMVFNTKIVKHRIYVSKNNGLFLGVLRYAFRCFRHFSCNKSIIVKQTPMSGIDLHIGKRDLSTQNSP